MRPAAFVLIREEERFLAHKRNLDRKVGLPGGIVNEGESPLTAAIREVKEEYGISLEPSALTYVGKVVNDKGREVYLWEYRLSGKSLESLLKTAEEKKDKKEVGELLILKLSTSLLKEEEKLHPTFVLQLRELLLAPPTGAVVSPSSPAPAGIIGNRQFLKAVKEVVEKALEEGKGVLFVQGSDGKLYPIVAEIRSRDKIPLCVADFTGETTIEGTKVVFVGKRFSFSEWEKTHRELSETERMLNRWETISRELSFFLISKVMEKDFELYERLNRKLKFLLWDETGTKRVPEKKELIEFVREIEEKGIPTDELKLLIK